MENEATEEIFLFFLTNKLKKMFILFLFINSDIY